MARYRHYRNSDAPGQLLFITTTVLDFVHAFHGPDARDAMAFALIKECRLARAKLHAYVVMPHHIHLLLRLHDQMNGQQLMRVLKPNCAREVMKLLSEAELKQFDEQRGLNLNTFWQRSYRSLVVTDERVFWQKMRYIHANPVRAGLAQRAEDYPWSSARLFAEGAWTETGMPYDFILDSLRTSIAVGEGEAQERPEA